MGLPLAMSRGPQGFTKRWCSVDHAARAGRRDDLRRMFMESAHLGTPGEPPHSPRVRVDEQWLPVHRHGYLEGSRSVAAHARAEAPGAGAAPHPGSPRWPDGTTRTTAGYEGHLMAPGPPGRVAPHRLRALRGKVKVLDSASPRPRGRRSDPHRKNQGKSRYMPPEKLLRDRSTDAPTWRSVGVLLGKRWWTAHVGRDGSGRGHARLAESQDPGAAEDQEIPAELRASARR